uniref:Retrovirus-related Pol polyprotein from transposon TNT 1-94 n=1 Tax=Tanacetum cinerariifolium TaxID=118510 RepID=A0A6L2MLH6_TANCI|nr:retrovirus-related Pol polyprotein from transposon TNT 1-94 [Tanacetum cinerariifolium]
MKWQQQYAFCIAKISILFRIDSKSLNKASVLVVLDLSKVVAAAKLPILNPNESDLGKMRIKQYFLMTDYSLWEVILNGDSPTPTRIVYGVVQVIAPTTAEQSNKKSLERDSKGGIIILPPVSFEEHVAVQKETKARTLLLQSLPEDYIADFHHLDDAREIWLAIKARFGGNEESKKMRKTMLKQEFSEFSVSEEEGLHKSYDRFQKILSQLNQMQAKPDNDDVNIKFLRALPPSWSQVALTLKTRGGLEYLSFDDLYNKLRSLEIDVKGGSSYGSRSTTVAPTHPAFIGAASTNTKNDVLYSFVVENEPTQRLAYEDFEQVDEKARYSAFKISEVKTEEPKAMVSVDSMLNWNEHEVKNKNEEAEQAYGLIARFESDFTDHAGNTAGSVNPAAAEFVMMGISSKEVKFVESLARTKLDLGFKEYIGSDEVCDLSTPSVFDPEPENREIKSLYERFVTAGSMHEVPPPITQTFMLTSYKSDPEVTQATFVTSPQHQKLMTDFASCVSSPKTNDSFSTVDVKILPKSNVKDPSPTNGFPSCSFKENVKAHRNLCNKSGKADRIHCKNNFVRTKKYFVCGSKSHLIKDCDVCDSVNNFPSVILKAASVPAGSRNSSASTSAGRFIPAASRNRPASIHACRHISAGRFNKPTSFPAGRSIPTGWTNHAARLFFRPTNLYFDRVSWPGIYKHMSMNEERWGTAVKSSAGIVDSGCSRSMIRNKEKLDDFVQIKGSTFTFGGGDGKITGKEAVSTDCYVLNRVSITNPHNKTPYELLSGKVPNIRHLKPFGCQVTILNTSDHLGKFKGKADDGFLVGYAAHSYTRFKTNQPTGTHHTNIIAGTQDDDSEYECDEQAILVPLFPSNSFLGPKVHDSSAPMENNLDYAEELARLRKQEYEAHSAATKYGFEFSNGTAEMLHQADIETRRNLVLAAGDPAGSIVSTGGVPAGSIPAGSVPASHVPTSNVSAGSVPTSRVSAGSVPASHVPASSIPAGGVLAGSIDSAGFGDPTASESVPAVFTLDHAAVSPLPPEPSSVAKALEDPDWVAAMQEEMQQFYNQQVWKLVPLPDGKIAIGTKWILKNKRDAKGIVVRNKARLVAQGHRQEEDIDYDEVFARVARIEAIILFLAFASYMGFMVYQMDVKSAFLYGEIEEEVYVTQPKGFKDPHNPKHVYMVVKALYGLHQAPRACQDKYVKDMLKKFDMESVRIATTPYEVPKLKSKDELDDAVNVHLYRSMIGSLIYLIASRLDIMFACKKQTVVATSLLKLNMLLLLVAVVSPHWDAQSLGTGIGGRNKPKGRLTIVYSMYTNFCAVSCGFLLYAVHLVRRPPMLLVVPMFLLVVLVHADGSYWCINRVTSLENELGVTKKVLGCAVLKLVTRVKRLEGLLQQRKRRLVLSDFEGEDATTTEQDIDLNVLHKLASTSLGGDSTVEAAYTIYKAFQDAHASLDAGHDATEVPDDTTMPFRRTSTTRRRLRKPFTSSALEHVLENISAVEDTLPAGEGIPAAAPTILAGSTPIPAGSSMDTAVQAAAAPSSTIPAADKGKALMDTDASLPANLLSEQECILKNLHDYQLGEDLAKKLHAEQEAELSDQRQRELDAAQLIYTEADWLELMAKIATNYALSKQLLGDDVNEENMNERLGWTMKQVKALSLSQLKHEFEYIQRTLERSNLPNFKRTSFRPTLLLEAPSAKRARQGVPQDVHAASSQVLVSDPAVPSVAAAVSVLAAPSVAADVSIHAVLPDPAVGSAHVDTKIHADESNPDDTPTAFEQVSTEHTVAASTPSSLCTRRKHLAKKRVTPIVDIADDALIKFDSASDSDDHPLPYVPYASWEMVPSPLGSIHAYYDMKGHTKHFTSLRKLLHMMEKNDLRKLLGAVDNLYQREEPDTFALFLWGDLHVLFQSLDDEDARDFWRNQDSWRIRSWRLYPRAQVHVLETVDGRVIYMFVDVSYPLSAATLQRMLKHGLEVPKLLVGEDLTMAEQLVSFIKAALLNAQSVFLVAAVSLFTAVLFCLCCWNNDAILALTSEDLSRILMLTLSNSRLGEDCWELQN